MLKTSLWSVYIDIISLQLCIGVFFFHVICCEILRNKLMWLLDHHLSFICWLILTICMPVGKMRLIIKLIHTGIDIFVLCIFYVHCFMYLLYARFFAVSVRGTSVIEQFSCNSYAIYVSDGNTRGTVSWAEWPIAAKLLTVNFVNFKLFQ